MRAKARVRVAVAVRLAVLLVGGFLAFALGFLAMFGCAFPRPDAAPPNFFCGL